MPRPTTIAKATIGFIQAMEEVVRRFGDRLKRGPTVAREERAGVAAAAGAVVRAVHRNPPRLLRARPP